MSVKIGEVTTFADVKPDKAQVLKILEESAEVFSAWEDWQLMHEVGVLPHLVDEIADTIQACANLAAALGVDDFAPWMERCRKRNEERGRL